MNRQLRFVLDVDGVLADFLNKSLSLMKERFAASYHPDQVTEYDYRSLPGWERIQFAFWEVAAERGVATDIAAYPGALDLVTELRTMGEVVFATKPMAASETWCWERTRWLKEMLGASNDEIVFTGKKELVAGDLLVEDHVPHAAAYKIAHPDACVLLLDRPYNRSSQLSNVGVRRIYTLEDVKENARMVAAAHGL